jgi:DNA-binding IclR family transcriptional regulator
MAVVVGHGALEQNTQIDLARSELSRVAKPHDLKSAIVTVIGHEIVTVGRGGPLTGQHLTFVGQREPHEPPFGSIFVAWAAPELATAWLSRSRPPLDTSTTAQYERALRAIREEGRTVLVAQSQSQRLRFAVSSVVETDEDNLLVPFDTIEAARLHYIGVPIFDAFGAVSLGLFVDELPPHLGIDDIQDLADRLQSAARNVMTRTGGQHPAPSPAAGVY